VKLPYICENITESLLVPSIPFAFPYSKYGKIRQQASRDLIFDFPHKKTAKNVQS
jgi:hypothetical protein